MNDMKKTYFIILLVGLIALLSLGSGAHYVIGQSSSSSRTMSGKISTGNSSTTVLDADGVFTGTWEASKDYAMVYVTVKSDVASATDGLAVQQSADGSTILDQDVFTIPAGTTKTFSFQAVSAYVRVVYTNGGSGQSSFVLNTKYLHVYGKPSSHRIQDSISDEDDAELSKSVVTAETASGTFTNIGASDSGNLKITDAENGLAIAKGEVVGSSAVHKFGAAPDFDTADGEVTVWDGAEDGASWELMRYVYSTGADIDSISSDDAGDDQEITIVGQDANNDEVTQTADLNGQTRVALTTPLYRVYRAYNSDSTEFDGHVFIYENGALTGGVPDTAADIRLVIHSENQQTEMAIFTVPAGYTAYARSWHAALAGANKSSNYVIKFYVRNPGGVFRLQHKASVGDSGTSMIRFQYTEPIAVPEKSDIEMTVEMQAVGGTAASVAGGFDLVLVED